MSLYKISGSLNTTGSFGSIKVGNLEHTHHLTGSVELGPITGMTEAIVDLVATGRTLRDNGLIEVETLFESTARLVGNPLALRLDRGELLPILEAIRPKETAK